MVEGNFREINKYRTLQEMGLKDSRNSGETITLTRDDLPWLTKEKRTVNLALVTLTSGKVVYLGSAIEGKKLQQIAAKSDNSTKQLISAVTKIIQNEAGCNALSGTNCPYTIFSLVRTAVSRGDKPFRSTNTYFMVSEVNNIPTFIRLATARSTDETAVQNELRK